MAPVSQVASLALGALSVTSAFVAPSLGPTARSATASKTGLSTSTFTSTQVPLPSNTIVRAAPFPFFDFKPRTNTESSTVNPRNRKIAVITGTSSGLGKATLKALAARGDYYIICAVRDPEKMQAVARELNISPDMYTIRYLDLGSFESVRRFAKEVKSIKGGKPLDSLVCNAAVYLPAKSVPTYTPDGIEESLQINHLSHFLLVSLLMTDLQRAKDPRCIIVGSITGNDNTIAGAFVWPRASLGNLKGMEQGAKAPISMIDGATFNGAKAYKDSKMCNMMTVLELDKRYHEATGISFNSMYPGCIAETALFREKRQWFRTLFPIFMKYVTGGYVSEDEAGERLAQCLYDPALQTSGNYWCWNGQAQQFGYYDPATKQVRGAGGSGGRVFPGQLAGQVLDGNKAKKMWDLSCQITGASWPKIGVKEGALAA